MNLTLLSFQQLNASRHADYAALGKFIGLAEMGSELPPAQVLSRLREILQEYNEDREKCALVK